MSATADSYKSIYTELWDYNFSHGWIDVKGNSTRYIHTGSDDKPAVIFCHGVLGHAEAWIAQLGPFGEHFNTYAIDLLGNGRTDKPEIEYHMPVLAEHVRDFMDTVGVDKATVVGGSYGSRVATRTAVNHPDRVDKMILVTAHDRALAPDAAKRIIGHQHKSVAAPTWETATEMLVNHVTDPSVVYDDLIQTRMKVFQQPELKAAVDRLMVVHHPDTSGPTNFSDDELRGIQAPTLVVRGIHDAEDDVSESRGVSELIPNGRFVTITGSSHWPYFEQADQFNRIAIDFLLET